MAERKDRRGERYGSLLVVERGDNYRSPKGAQLTTWVCLCDCGNTKIVIGTNLTRTLSCGCLTGNENHGMSDTITYRSYTNMIDRTRNAAAYPSYAEKGILVCDRWLESFLHFIEDMGERPSKQHTLDRVNPEDHYYKENCRWTDDNGLQVYNRSIQKSNTSGVVGISWSKVCQKWHAYISKDGKAIHLGYFSDKEKAIKVRKEAEIEYYGFNV